MGGSVLREEGGRECVERGGWEGVCTEMQYVRYSRYGILLLHCCYCDYVVMLLLL